MDRGHIIKSWGGGWFSSIKWICSCITNFNVLSCFLLLENDRDKLAEAIHRTMISVDKFINYTKSDGACEEGPGYWGHAAGKMFDYLQLLSTATGGNVNIFDNSIIKNMGEYVAKSYIGDGWVVNFADAGARGAGNKGLIFRYGKAVNSEEMIHFASYLYENDKKNKYYYSGRDIYRTLENLKYYDELVNTESALSQDSAIWYPETEFCYMRNNTDFFFAAKGGYNAESHNHNDVGTFLLYYKNKPVFIDIGVGTYTRQTFSSERYSIWTMQSNYHNLPMINGEPQKNGAEYRSKDVQFNKLKHSFSLDISNAYQSDVNVEFWKRKYTLQPNGGLVIGDNFYLKKIKELNQINFMTLPKPVISSQGSVIFAINGQKIQLLYDKNKFEASIESIELTDRRLIKSWGNNIYRLKFLAKKKVKKGNYKFRIELL